MLVCIMSVYYINLRELDINNDHGESCQLIYKPSNLL